MLVTILALFFFVTLEEIKQKTKKRKKQVQLKDEPIIEAEYY